MSNKDLDTFNSVLWPFRC